MLIDLLPPMLLFIATAYALVIVASPRVRGRLTQWVPSDRSADENEGGFGFKPVDSGGLWFKWTAATAVGWILFIILSFFLLVTNSVAADYWQGILLLLAGMLLPGLLQWIVLRPWYPRPWLWLAASLLGTTASFIAFFRFSRDINLLAGVTLGTIYGLTSGFLQWLALGKTRGRLWWIAWAVVAWGASGGVAFTTFLWHSPSSVVQAMGLGISLIMFGALGGAITGIGIVHIFRKLGPKLDALRNREPEEL